MARLEEITVGASVIGIAGNAPVCIVAVKWYGNAVLEWHSKTLAVNLQASVQEDEEDLCW